MGRRGRGFTLIELLVVMVVIAIALGVVGAKLMPDDRDRLRHSAEQLALLMENATLQARSSGVPMAWVGKHDEYLFFRRDEQGLWEPLQQGPFRRRMLKDGITIVSVALDGKPVKLGTRVPISATSFSAPFHIRLGAGGATLYVIGNGVGAVTVSSSRNSGADAAR